MLKILSPFAVLFLPALALAQGVTYNPDDTSGLLDSLVAALTQGKIGFAAILALMVAVGYLRKLFAVKLDVIGTDLGGTLFGTALSMLAFVAGPLSAGAPLTLGLVTSALVGAWTVGGGFTMVKRLLTALRPNVIHPLLAKAGFAGSVVEWLIYSWVSGVSLPAASRYNADGTADLTEAQSADGQSAPTDPGLTG